MVSTVRLAPLVRPQSTPKEAADYFHDFRAGRWGAAIALRDAGAKDRTMKCENVDPARPHAATLPESRSQLPSQSGKHYRGPPEMWMKGLDTSENCASCWLHRYEQQPRRFVPFPEEFPSTHA